MQNLGRNGGGSSWSIFQKWEREAEGVRRKQAIGTSESVEDRDGGSGEEILANEKREVESNGPAIGAIIYGMNGRKGKIAEEEFEDGRRVVFVLPLPCL